MFGTRLKELRKNKGLSQKELGEKVNLSQQTIGHYEVERAKPDIETIRKLADFFNVSTDYLLGRATPTHIQAAHKTSDIPLSEEDLEYVEKLLAKAREDFKKKRGQ